MKNSIKQLIRTPLKTILFLLLIVVSTVLVVLGTYLWQRTQQTINHVEESFVTIGTVEQKPDRVQIVSGWDAASQANYYENQLSYDAVIPISILNFEGADYIQSPEKRPYYTTILPDYVTQSANAPVRSMGLIAEFTPVETCIPSEPVAVKINQILSGVNPGTETIYVCNHWVEHSEVLEKGKIYIAHLNAIPNYHTDSDANIEYTFSKLQSSTQCDALGNRLESSVNMDGQTFDEVTEGFYETEHGRYWMAMAEGITDIAALIPVLPTNSMNLLPNFHSYAVSVTDGREITEEEFKNGKPVCLVSVDFARMNDLVVGDAITLPLYHANYRYSPHITFGDTGGLWTYSFVNAENDVYESFCEETYEVVGLYYGSSIYGQQPGSIEIAQNMFIIPQSSIKASDEKNIVEYGPMLHSTTSFQIANGTAAEYMEAFNRNVPSEIRDYLEITFNDNGYEQVIKGLNNMRYVAILLFAVGLFSEIAIIMLFLYLFVVRQRKRTAIERSLGMNKHQCRMSLVLGVMVLTIAATTLGIVNSMFLIDKVETVGRIAQQEQLYSTEYSGWTGEEVKLLEDTESKDTSEIWWSFVAPIALVVVTTLFAVILVNRNLKIEPIELLNARDP